MLSSQPSVLQVAGLQGARAAFDPYPPICMLIARATGKLETVKLSHPLLSLRKQPGCLAAGDSEVEVKGWKGGAEQT